VIHSFSIDYVFKDIYDFLQNLEREEKNRTQHHLHLLEEYGPFLTLPFCKKIQPNLYELRISARIQIRIFYSFVGTTAIPLHVFVKKTQKLPKKELKRALARKQLLESL